MPGCEARRVARACAGGPSTPHRGACQTAGVPRIVIELQFPANDTPGVDAGRVSGMIEALDEYGPGELELEMEPAPSGGARVVVRFEMRALDLHGAINKSMAGLGQVPADFPDATLLTVTIEPVAAA